MSFWSRSSVEFRPSIFWLRETLQEFVQMMLIDVNLSLVDVVQHKPETFRVHSTEVEQRMGVRVPLEDWFEEWTGGCQDQLVSWYLCLVITDQGHVVEIFLSSQNSEGLRNNGLKVCSLQAHFLVHLDSLQWLSWMALRGCIFQWVLWSKQKWKLCRHGGSRWTKILQ